MNHDLSDESYFKWVKNTFGKPVQELNPLPACLGFSAWREASRRAEAMIEEEKRKAFEAAWSMRGSGFHSVCPSAWRAYQAERSKQ
jgi:hypothetical protein